MSLKHEPSGIDPGLRSLRDPLQTPTLAGIQDAANHSLDLIPRSIWYQLGASCHNQGFAMDVASVPAPGSLIFPSGIPRILAVIQQQRSRALENMDNSPDEATDTPLLWRLYAILKQKYKNASPQRKRKNPPSDPDADTDSMEQCWQIRLLKASCPEIFVLSFLETFQEHGRLVGFEREMPRDLLEAIDYELCSHSEPAKKAVYALMQTLIGCRRYLKAFNSTKQIVEGEESYHQMALDLEEAFVAMEVSLDIEATLPKLSSLYEQEVAADVKAHSRAGANTGVKRSGATSTTPVIGSGVSMPKDQPSAPGTLRTTAQLVEQAQSGALIASSAANAGSNSTLSTTAQNAKIKVSNPLWSPTLGQNYMPQWPTKYVNQIDVELRRWFALIAHVNGAAFSENLTALIKAVYPSDQKFLLDLILIEYMCLEVMSGSDQADREDDAAFSWTDLALTTHEDRTKTPGEKVVETIMSALVSLVIKPEDGSTYLEPGSKRWVEPMDPSAWDQLDGEIKDQHSLSTAAPVSAAFGGSKVKKRRNLYNRRVSPFYAILAMFTPKRVTGRAQGVLYLSPEELAVKETGPSADDTATQEGLLLLGLETALPAVREDENPDPIIEYKKKNKKKKGHKDRDREQRPQIHGQGQAYGHGHPQGQGQGQGGLGLGQGQARRMSAAGGGKKKQAPTKVQPVATLRVPETEDEKEDLDLEELQRAKEAELKRMGCQAPFRVLMMILQNLTRVNQAGALDNWIADALSGTVLLLQIQYFQWLLRSLVVGSLSGQSEASPTPAPVSAPAIKAEQDTAVVKTENDMDVDGSAPRTRDEDEVVRMVSVLVATPGIGYDPLKKAFDRFLSQDLGPYKSRLSPVQQILDKHFATVAVPPAPAASALQSGVAFSEN
ncbi:hypothetical protein EMPS_07730 [Entomortierella parvispora]|uniref:Uncharacterized protein n=1 Tax=Entomortierella parvispora TaxID=205924 RepID=A0A9P3HEY3_9FUNG|nr:hypothetical protein EMPS_07730 [Entomortierella parvispora]